MPFAVEVDYAIAPPSIVDLVLNTALCLWLQEPDAPALKILDRAMRAFEGEDLDFEFDEELEPPHPFAELVRRAFAPHLHPAELFATTVEIETVDSQLRTRIESVQREWRVAIRHFAERYGIWDPE